MATGPARARVAIQRCWSCVLLEDRSATDFAAFQWWAFERAHPFTPWRRVEIAMSQSDESVRITAKRLQRIGGAVRTSRNPPPWLVWVFPGGDIYAGNAIELLGGVTGKNAVVLDRDCGERIGEMAPDPKSLQMAMFGDAK